MPAIVPEQKDEPILALLQRAHGGVPSPPDVSSPLAIPPMAHFDDSPIPEWPQFLTERAANFILGATYMQEDVPVGVRGNPDEVMAAYAEARCMYHGAVGYFFQTHTNGHEIVGFYMSVDDMVGQRVRHGHTRGWLSFPPPTLSAGDGRLLDLEANFIPNAPYFQIDLPADAKNTALPVSLEWCLARCKENGAAGFFYQEHTNGHEIVGFFEATEPAATSARTRGGHARGLVVVPRVQTETEAAEAEGIQLKPASEASSEAEDEAEVEGDSWVIVHKAEMKEVVE